METDINRRKILAIAAYNTLVLKNIFNNRYNSMQIKARAFNAYIASIFLHNSELCTLTKNLKNTINTKFQRRQFRNILEIH